MKTTLAIDPGGTTGCALRLSNGDLLTFTLATMTRPTKKEVLFHPQLLADTLNMDGLDRVVYEDFAAETISMYGLHTVRLCGLIIGICHIRDIPLIRHTPMERRPFIEDAKMALNGRKLLVIHEIDATAHLLKLEKERGQ